MVNKIVFWTGFGLVVRLWQIGIEQRPFFNKESLWVYPVFAATGASFGYWMTNVTARQNALLAERRKNLLEKRRRRGEREEGGGQVGTGTGTGTGASEGNDLM